MHNQDIDFHFIIIKKSNVGILCGETKSMADYVHRGLRRIGITISKPILALMCIIFGILVIVFPDLLRWIVALFLIIQGVLVLTDYLELKK